MLLGCIYTWQCDCHSGGRSVLTNTCPLGDSHSKGARRCPAELLIHVSLLVSDVERLCTSLLATGVSALQKRLFGPIS